MRLAYQPPNVAASATYEGNFYPNPYPILSYPHQINPIPQPHPRPFHQSEFQGFSPAFNGAQLTPNTPYQYQQPRWQPTHEIPYHINAINIGLNNKRVNSKMPLHHVPVKYRKLEYKRQKPPVTQFPNNLLEIKPVDNLSYEKVKHLDIVHNETKEATNKEANRDKTLKEQEARRLAKLLEQEIKEDIRKMSIEKLRIQNEQLKTQHKNSGPKPEVQQHQQTQIQREKTIKPHQREMGALVLKIELEEMLNTLYEIVSVRTEEGDLVTWKTPVMVKPTKEETERFTLYVNNIRRDKRVVGRRIIDGLKLRGFAPSSMQVPVSRKLQTTSQLSEKRTTVKVETISTQDIPNSCVVRIENLSRSTISDYVESLANKVGVLSSFTHDRQLGRAELTFDKPEEAQQFYAKFNRKMVDLSKISVSVV